MGHKLSNYKNTDKGLSSSRQIKIQQAASQPDCDPLLLKKKQVADLLNIGPTTVPQFLSARGIEPIDLGPGRGKGLRWLAAAVIEIPGIVHAEAQAKASQPKTRKARQKFSMRGKTAAQLVAEFNEGIETRAEVRNGN